jgi:hypothetical protein
LLKGKDGKTISFNVPEAYTIRNIKENIQEMEDIGPLNQVQLVEQHHNQLVLEICIELFGVNF